MIDMINDQFCRSFHYPAVHRNGFSATFSDCVKCVTANRGEPLKLAQLVIILRIDEGEFPLRKRDPSDYFIAGPGTRVAGAGMEICAFIAETYIPPLAGRIFLLVADKERAVQAHHPDRK